ncbi:hypothetical protein BDV19DRAFT_31722 [Aspergillus venezuelensis]
MFPCYESSHQQRIDIRIQQCSLVGNHHHHHQAADCLGGCTMCNASLTLSLVLQLRLSLYSESYTH